MGPDGTFAGKIFEHPEWIQPEVLAEIADEIGVESSEEVEDLFQRAAGRPLGSRGINHFRNITEPALDAARRPIAKFPDGPSLRLGPHTRGGGMNRLSTSTIAGVNSLPPARGGMNRSLFRRPSGRGRAPRARRDASGSKQFGTERSPWTPRERG